MYKVTIDEEIYSTINQIIIRNLKNDIAEDKNEDGYTIVNDFFVKYMKSIMILLTDLKKNQLIVLVF
ncbi:MAG: hypothetical protein JJE21_03395 [Spirochaetaceae bacterium]|nr:hypothetical protein [Spirochaetaceae bacterium]